MVKSDETPQMTHIVIASYPKAQKAAILGLQDLLTAAGEFHTSGFKISIRDTFTATHETFDVVILPPSMGANLNDVSDENLANWLRAQHASGALICSVCVGAFYLAATGLLDGRPATTHWELTDQFRKRFPQVQLNTEKLIIEDGDLITAGGLMAWADLGLLLIARFLGPATMQKTAKLFLLDPGKREQSYYNVFAPDLTHGDKPIKQAQQWIQAHFSDAITVPDMARESGLEERTFLRRFQATTGWRPSEYLQQLRIAHAREHLERTQDNIGIIAAAVGYSDVASFSKLFQKTVGLPPGEYRRRFTPARN